MSGKTSPSIGTRVNNDEESKVGDRPQPSAPNYELKHDSAAYIEPEELHAAGVKRIEAISAHLKPWERAAVFCSCFLIAYVYGLDGTIRYTYQSYATASYSLHSLLATINVLRSVIGAVGQPTAAKIADVFGRFELVCVSVVFYVIGTIVEATSTWVTGFSAGAVLYQVGYTMIILLIEVIIADLTSLRSRLFFSFVPALPFIINTWISGDITAQVLANSTWEWGIGMFGIIYPVCTLPLLFFLYMAQRRATAAGELAAYRTPFQALGWRLPIHLFWSLDVIGIVLMIAAFGLFLVPFTLAGGSSSTWSEAHIIAPLVIGILCFPAFAFWESRCKYPLVPFKLLKDRGVWAGFGIAVFLNGSWYMQYDYLYPVLVVALDQSVKSATRITALYSFASVITGTLCGLVVIRVRQLKPFIMFGVCVFTVAMGLLIRFRGGSLNDVSGVIGAQVLLGIGAGFFSYPTQASVQARTKHEHVAVITGLYLASYYIGSALGSTISGAIWTQTMPGELASRIGQYNATLPALVYGDPYTYAPLYPIGSDVRTGIIEAYAHVQKIMCGVGLAFCIPLIIFSVLLRNPELGKEQSLPDAEEESVSDAGSRKFHLWK